MRYLQPMLLQERVVHDRLSRICHGDYDREITLVAETRTGDEGNLHGVVRLSKLYGTSEARLSILVGDLFQGNGLGSELVCRAIDVAISEHITRLSATLTSDNQVMLHIFQKLGFRFEPDSEGKYVSAIIDL